MDRMKAIRFRSGDHCGSIPGPRSSTPEPSGSITANRREVGRGLRGEYDAIAVQDGRDGAVVNEKRLPHDRHPDGGDNERGKACSDAVVTLT